MMKRNFTAALIAAGILAITSVAQATVVRCSKPTTITRPARAFMIRF